MHHGTIREHQLTLFREGVAWQELPREVRQEAISLFATLCVEIVQEIPSTKQEQGHESSRD
jgi:hypothetical protein